MGRRNSVRGFTGRQQILVRRTVDMRGDDRPGAPDGMKVDEDGRLWTTGAGGVWVLEPDGSRLGVFEMEEHAANLAFGGPAFSTLYLTAGHERV